MPTQTIDRLSNVTYDQLVNFIQLSGGDVDKYIAEANKYGISEWQAVEDMAASHMDFYSNGDGTYTITGFNSPINNTVTNAIDSNVSTTSRGTVRQMLNRGVDNVTNKFNITKYPASGSMGQQASYFLGSVAGAVTAVSAGLTLGKTIDSTLYNLNPDFWNEAGMSTLNPETWSTLTNGDDSNFAGLLNMVLGIDPSTGQAQAYMDEDTFAYMAYYMSQQGVFSSAGIHVDPLENFSNQTVVESSKVLTGNAMSLCALMHPECIMPDWVASRISGAPYGLVVMDASNSETTGSKPKSYQARIYLSPTPWEIPDETLSSVRNVASFKVGTINHPISLSQYVSSIIDVVTASTGNNTTYPNQWVAGYASSNITISNMCNLTDFNVNTTSVTSSNRSMVACNISTVTPIDGISNQDGATLPDISTWEDIPSTLSSLKQQYPDLWNNALVWDNVQPDGTNPQITYIPVGMPQITSNLDTQPTSGTQTQSDTRVSPQDELLTALITQLATQTATDTSSATITPPQNPVDTGSGDSPISISPVGSASALWSVYHPTQAQINSFGAWLWGSVFTTDIRKLFEDPIQGVISLHKIFANPVDSGTGTIVVGTLDSNVSSATVNQQYVTVDCGIVDCYEYFGNVFDYPPFTKISLYLPFIGIVPLDTDEVMRSSIQIIYGVDVFTGACLAMIKVSRDGNTVNMYQHAGVCSVEYPLSNVQHSQMFSGLLSIAAGVATVATAGGAGGVAAGAIGIAGGAGAAANTHVGKSGGFSGNAGAMGIKKPYLIIERPQTKVAQLFPSLSGYPTNKSGKLSDFEGQVVVSDVHVEGMTATDTELSMIEDLLKEGVLL